MSNNEVAIRQKPKFSVAIGTEKYQNLINSTLRDPERARRFTAAITSAVATNPTLQECDAGSILSAALLGEALNLSPSPQLGQYYLVPFNCKVKDPATLAEYDEKRAQFQLGYKGYIQLAIRSGQYKKLIVSSIKAGELRYFDPLTEDITIELLPDEEREEAETVGYYAMFELMNGFRKAIYWSREKMEHHALTYSRGYAAKKGYTFWEKNFDEMANKTMIRQLISKWGIMSIEMQDAIAEDIRSEANEDYIEAPSNRPEIIPQPEPTAGEPAKEVSLNDL